MPRIVVLGTGTGVGKSYFTAALARALQSTRNAPAVVALKPIETGVRRRSQDGSPPEGSDAALLESASNSAAPRPHPLFAFPEPISPHLAAEHARALAGRGPAAPRASPARVPRTPTLRGAGRSSHVSIPAVLRWAADAEIAIHATAIHRTHWQLLETAGGAFSPLTRRTTNADLAAALDPAFWILVAPDSLGVFHDVRATLVALEATARLPDFLVLSAAREPDSATGLNAAEFPRLGLPRPLAVLDRHRGADVALAPLVRALVRRSADVR
jgi:dethiobiotin synthetase